MKKDNKTIIKGIVALFLGVLVEIAYLCKCFPFNISTSIGMSLLTAWSMLGWAVALLLCMYGMCKIYLEETPKKGSRK